MVDALNNAAAPPASVHILQACETGSDGAIVLHSTRRGPAIGGVPDRDAVGRLGARMVCGGANNVPATSEDADRLADRGILYAPDEGVNAGEIIDAAAQHPGWPAEAAKLWIEAAGRWRAEVLDHADRRGSAPHRAADAPSRSRVTALRSHAEGQAA